jgi:hypothetical protein
MTEIQIKPADYPGLANALLTFAKSPGTSYATGWARGAAGAAQQRVAREVLVDVPEWATLGWSSPEEVVAAYADHGYTLDWVQSRYVPALRPECEPFRDWVEEVLGYSPARYPENLAST